MAPSTRSSRQGSISKRAPARRPRAQSTREASHSRRVTSHDDDDYDHDERADQNGHTDKIDGAHHYNGNLIVETREPVDFGEDVDGVDVEEALHPLREMAERVGREVETFAESLDQFLDNLPTRNKFDAVLQLVEEFKAIAQHAELALERSHRRDLAQQLRQEWSEQANVSTQTSLFGPATGSKQQSKLGSSLAERKAEQVKQLRQWQQEVDLWELFRIILLLHHNPDRLAIQEEKEDALRSLGTVHRYTSEADIWQRFLLHDDLARERSLIKTWLEQTADHQQSGLPGIMEALESKAGRGAGLWSHGWVDTREKIKSEKRLRSWPETPGAPLPQIRRSDNNELLVTTLDADAPSRQDRTLEKADAYFERAMWIACWEMLRRGKPWDEVSEWCSKRKEGWRAISIGRSIDPSDVVSNAAWRNMCYLASQSGYSNDYEAAVYGLLGGSVSAVQKICRSMDDSLYAYYSAALIRQFDQHLAVNYPDRASRALRGPTEDALKDPQDQIVSLILKLRKQSTTTREAVTPMKILQSYLLANDIGSMVHTLGYAIAFADQLRKKGEDMIIHLEPFWQGDANQPEGEVALNPQTLRISTHIATLMRTMTDDVLVGAERDAEENVLVAYIQALRAAGKRDLIPIYASRLARSRCVVTMARVLEDVTSASEQETLLSLMHQYGMDSILILDEQLLFLLNEYLASHLLTPRPLKMLEKTDDTNLYPGQRIVAGFLPTELTTQDEAIFRSVQWFNMIRGYWNETFKSLSFAVRKCLVAGRLACAMSIVNEFPYENVSIRKSYQIIKKSINMMEYDGPPPEDVSLAQWNSMKEHSRTYYELEHLISAVKALAAWRDSESDTKNALQMSTAPPDLKAAKEAVDELMAPIVSGQLLLNPLDDDEETDLAFIRSHYIPEMVLAYNTVLHTAGNMISRDILIESMDLSVSVAEEGNKVADYFVESGRMRELVTSFAQTSKAMLVLKARKPWKSRRDREGKDLGIWEIGPQGDFGLDGPAAAATANRNVSL